MTDKLKTIERKNYLIDAKDKSLGRLATQVTLILIGKNKPEYQPHQDYGDNVIIINASKVKVTGKKFTDKEYIHHTGYIGHLKRKSYKDVFEHDPRKVIEMAVWGMLPKNRLRKVFIKKMRVFVDDKHSIQDVQEVK